MKLPRIIVAGAFFAIVSVSSAETWYAPFDQQIVQIKVGDQTCSVFPTSNADTTDQAGPFFYQRPVELQNIAIISDKFSATFFFRSASSDEETHALDKIGKYYGGGDAAKTTAKRLALNAINLKGYQVELKLANGKILPLAKRIEELDSPALIQLDRDALTVNAQVPELAVIPAGDIKSITVIFRAIYPTMKKLTSKLSASMSKRAFSDSLEKISSGGKPQVGDIVISRDAKQQFQSRMISEFTAVLSGQSSTLAQHSNEILKTMLDNVFKSSTLEAQAQSKSVFIWTPEIGRIEIQPDKFKNVINSLENSSDYKNQFTTFWKHEAEHAKDAKTAEKWHNDVKGRIETGAQAEGLFGLVGSAEGHFNADWDVLTSGEKEQANKLYDKVAAESYGSTELLSKTYEKWTGEKYSEGSVAKALNIWSVATIDQVEKWIVNIVQEEEQALSTYQAPAEFAAQGTAYNDLIASLQARVKTLENRVTDMGDNAAANQKEIGRQLNELAWINQPSGHWQGEKLGWHSFLALISNHIQGSGPNWEQCFWKDNTQRP